MRSITFRHAVPVAFAALSVATLAACSGDGEPTDPHDQVAAVHEALSDPSGTVEKGSMKTLVKSFDSIEVSQPVFASLGFVGTESCRSGSATEGTYDLSCATEGKASGTLDFKAEVSGGGSSAEAFLIVTFEDACSDGVCVNGTAASQVTIDNGQITATLAFSADVSKDGAKTHVFFGSEASVGDGSASGKFAVFDTQGDSFVFTGQVDSEGASWSVTGNNGSFSCSESEGAGQCTGSATFDY